MRGARRSQLLREWASSVDRAGRVGALTGDSAKPIQINKIETVAGPRAGALEIDAGLNAGRLLRVLSADEGAITRQFIPWRFVGEPGIYMASRFVRIEAGWPDELAERKIKLSDLNTHPHRSGRWCVGKSESGRAVTMGFTNNLPHILVAGTTGSGKSVTLRSIVAQLATRGDQLVLVDGKFGDGLRRLDKLPGVVGPLATDIESAKGALSWVVSEMAWRYKKDIESPKRIVVVIDEVQDLIKDAAIAEMIRRIAAQGRSALVSLILATQHPVNASFGDVTVKRNIIGRIALRVADAKSSEVAIGQSTPRADHLFGCGDAYVVVPGSVERLQVAYVPRSDLDRLLGHEPTLLEWPEFEAERTLNSRKWPEGSEVGAAIVSASRGEGRVKFARMLREVGLAGMSPERAVKLLKLARGALDWLGSQGVSVRSFGDENTQKSSNNGKSGADAVSDLDRTNGRVKERADAKNRK